MPSCALLEVPSSSMLFLDFSNWMYFSSNFSSHYCYLIGFIYIMLTLFLLTHSNYLVPLLRVAVATADMQIQENTCKQACGMEAYILSLQDKLAIPLLT